MSSTTHGISFAGCLPPDANPARSPSATYGLGCETGSNSAPGNLSALAICGTRIPTMNPSGARLGAGGGDAYARISKSSTRSLSNLMNACGAKLGTGGCEPN